MSALKLRKKLIEKIQKTDDDNLLKEAYRLLELDAEDIEIYKLSDDPKQIVNEASTKFRTENI